MHDLFLVNDIVTVSSRDLVFIDYSYNDDGEYHNQDEIELISQALDGLVSTVLSSRSMDPLEVIPRIALLELSTQRSLDCNKRDDYRELFRKVASILMWSVRSMVCDGEMNKKFVGGQFFA